MKIDSASYSLASSHLARSRDEKQESLRAWRGNRRPEFEARGKGAAAAPSFSAAGRALAALPPPPTIAPAQAPEVTAIEEVSEAVDNDPFLRLIKTMVEMLTGRSIRIFSPQEVPPAATPPAVAGQAPAPQPATAARPAGFGIEYDYHAVHEEFEQTRLAAQGSITTAEGAEFTFTLDLTMTRSYREESSVSFRLGDAARKDPLVLNFDGAAVQLADRRFSFDLDSDGRPENLALLAGGNGYLAIDRNGNGKIDSGRELFGPATDSGFGELAALDGDRNGWIDENDAAFAALRIWTPATGSAGTLQSLRQREVGAIAVGSVASLFELRGAGNGNLGAIAASGVFLTEDGRAGAVQEIDLTL